MSKTKRNPKAKNVHSPRFSFRILYIILVVFLISLYPVYNTMTDDWTYVKRFGIRLPLQYTMHGIDVSHHNNTIDWHQVRHADDDIDIQFCFIKATEGTDLKDPDFETNWKEAKKVGLKRGAYHFYVNWSDPKLQAQNFIESVTLQNNDFVPALDFETEVRGEKAGIKLIENISIFLKLLENHYHVKPIIYTNRHVYRKYVKNNFDDYPLWISDFQSLELEGFENSRLMIWQHSQRGKISGIKGHVDFNVFVASQSHLDDICIRKN